MKKIKILYVFGYGSSPESSTYHNLKKYLPSDRFEVISDYYAQYNPTEALTDIGTIISNEKVDFVVGSSLGGYLTLNLRGIPKLVLNPCVHPEVELEKLTKEVQRANEKGEPMFYPDGNPITDTVPAVPEHIVKFYKEYADKNDVWKDFDSEEKLTTVALMADHDELFGTKYKNEVSSHVKWVYDVAQGHHSTEESVRDNLVPYILKWFDEISPKVKDYFKAGVHA